MSLGSIQFGSLLPISVKTSDGWTVEIDARILDRLDTGEFLVYAQGRVQLVLSGGAVHEGIGHSFDLLMWGMKTRQEYINEEKKKLEE